MLENAYDIGSYLFMFKINTGHLHSDLFGICNTLSEKKKTLALQSSDYYFYKIVYLNIDEKIFSMLYSSKKSRPNAPVNCMVAAFILMQQKAWTFDKLFTELQFNLLTNIAIGNDDFEKMPFCPATFFNFLKRLYNHFTETGEDLIEQVFDNLTSKQLKALKIKTNIQRTDSFMANSNIKNYTRLQLLLELVRRIYRNLSDDDKEGYKEKFGPYIKKSSGQYIYSLTSADIPKELEKIASLYYWINKDLKERYLSLEIFKVFERLFLEHFMIVQDKIKVKEHKQLHSSCVQSIDDMTATYRKKKGKQYRGQSINVFETAHPENPINLIIDVATNPNNKDDSKVLNERIDIIKNKTPDLDELHHDGGYGSQANDIALEKHKILAIQTAVRGATRAVDITIEQINEREYKVNCPNQNVVSKETRKRYKACFDKSICHQCEKEQVCSTIEQKYCRVFYFTHDDFLNNKRQQNIKKIPLKRRTLRNNVEATVKEFTHRMPNKKMKVRGIYKTALFSQSVAIAINFGRIYRYILNNPEIFKELYLFVRIIIKMSTEISPVSVFIEKIKLTVARKQCIN